MSEVKFSGRTQVLALIADPLVRAKSPNLVNQLLLERGQLGDYVLVPLQVPAAGLGSVITALRHVGNFCGAIVSMPHKSAITPLLERVSAEAELTHAVNVIRREPNGDLAGTCLDGEGMVAGLRAKGHEVKGKSCLLLGAGGAASAIAMALARHGCRSLTIENRTSTRASALALAVGSAFPACQVRAAHNDPAPVDILINATSLGMNPDDPLPVAAERLERAALVAECVVTHEVTPLLRAAQERGRQTHAGLPMLEAQLELMLEFMGVPAR